jgi:Histidine kinase-, DNA gyrase B-, and HSP90-like ATPase
MPSDAENAEPNRSLIADFDIGPSSIMAYRRLNYTLWYALAEFIDNTTQSRDNYSDVIDPVLKDEGSPLRIDINYNPTERSITLIDNSIGMSYDRLVAGLKIAHPTVDTCGRSRYGMGMKTAACWIGKDWHVRTCAWQSSSSRSGKTVNLVVLRNSQSLPTQFRSNPNSTLFNELVNPT